MTKRKTDTEKKTYYGWGDSPSDIGDDIFDSLDECLSDIEDRLDSASQANVWRIELEGAYVVTVRAEPVEEE